MDIISVPARRSLRKAAAALAALGLVLALGACGGDDDDSSGAGSGDGGSGGSGSADATLEVDANAYHDLSAPAGGTLEIVNSSGAAHTFTADDGAFDESYGADETVVVDLPDEAGDYAFHCEIHPSMTGTLTAE
ncbi:MAG: cupredoxin domain-containing protein [Acidimicrobiales bacterium]